MNVIRRERLDRAIVVNEAHLRCILKENFMYYTLEKNHQGLDNELVEKTDVTDRTQGAIKRKERIGGLLSYYYREAT